ncbi:MAG: hypothetical protein DMF98_27725 [Acidobacteria bacterium]|nr:MAG: hypothetical protein DMF98_27725 [Acidobacteriota bacterium]
MVNIAYGDGFYVAVDPNDHRTIYANSQSGRTYLVDLETREEQGLRPVPIDRKEEFRFNWSTPMLMSPHDAKIVYYGGNKLFMTNDRGHRWQPISPDLTRNQDWKKLPIMGPARSDQTLSRDDGVSDFGTITTIAESPVKAGVLYVGTDDGNVQMTSDAGRTWRDLTSKFKLPGPRWVSRVMASRHDGATVYVAFDGHQDDDFKPYLFKSTDSGTTWTPVAGDLPDGMVIHSLAEHPRNRDLLLAGTEFGLFVTNNGGRNWTLVRGNLPRVRIDDILITPRENDIVLGTHGRSIIVLDDASLLENAVPAVLTEDVHLFPTRQATEYYEMRMLPSPGAAKFAGPNPDSGALITYSIKSPPASSNATVKIEILDRDNHVVRELEGPDRQGFNRVAWDLRFPVGFIPIQTDEGWFGPPRGTLVLPGEYRIKLTARGREQTGSVQVRVDPRAHTTPEGLQARFSASQRVGELVRSFVEAAAAADNLSAEIDAIRKAVTESKSAPEVLRKHFDEVSGKVETAKTSFRAGFGGPKFRYLDLAGQLQASTTAPTEAQMTTLDHLAAELTENITTLNALITNDVAQLESELRANNLSPFAVRPVTLPKPR